MSSTEPTVNHPTNNSTPTSIQRHHSTNQLASSAHSQSSSSRPSSLSSHHQFDCQPISRSNSLDSVAPHSPALDSISNSSNISNTTPLSLSSTSSITLNGHNSNPNTNSYLNSNPSSSSNSNTSLFDPLPQLPSRLRQATLKLVPPPNFGFIEGSLFRSGEPSELSLNFIQRLKLHSLLWLAPQPPSLKFQEFLAQNSIQFHNLGIQHAASLDAVTEEAVTHALQLILNPSIYPLMIMCAGGSHRTGTVVGCLRKLQGWNLASIFEEYRRYAGAQHHIMNEQFIEFYDINRLAQGLMNEDLGKNSQAGKKQASDMHASYHATLPPSSISSLSLSPASSSSSTSSTLAHQHPHLYPHPQSSALLSNTLQSPFQLTQPQPQPHEVKRATPSDLGF